MTVSRRRFVPPLGRRSGDASASGPRIGHQLISFNRYPRQVIGIVFRLPRDNGMGHPAVSLLWAKPAAWWRR